MSEQEDVDEKLPTLIEKMQYSKEEEEKNNLENNDNKENIKKEDDNNDNNILIDEINRRIMIT